MGLEVGQRVEAEIIGNGIRTLGDKDAISIKFEAEGETGESLIFLTPKSMGIARAKLKLCGFNADTESLAVLVENPTRLAGRKIPIEVDEYKGRMQFVIPMSDAPSKKRVAELDAQMKKAKGGNQPDAIEEDSIPF